jgi:hypothetical protein
MAESKMNDLFAFHVYETYSYDKLSSEAKKDIEIIKKELFQAIVNDERWPVIQGNDSADTKNTAFIFNHALRQILGVDDSNARGKE